MAGDSQLLFQQGLQAYGRGDVTAAEDTFRTLVEQGHDGPDVLYNLGTTALAQGKIGEAVYALEQARRAGGGSDVEANLTIARGRQLDQLVGAQGEEPFVERVATAHRQLQLGKRLERRIESRIEGIHAEADYRPLSHENHDFAEPTGAGRAALHHNVFGRVCGDAGRLSTQETHMWTKPEYTEMRFGFEVTMYIASR